MHILFLISHLLHFYCEASFYEFLGVAKVDFLCMQQIFIRHDNERKFNYIQFCINICYFFFLFFLLNPPRRSRGNYIVASLWKISRAWKRLSRELERSDFFDIPPPLPATPLPPVDAFDQENSSCFVPYLKIYFLSPLRTPERAETRSGNSNRSSKSSSRAKLYTVRKQEARFFFAFKMLSYAVQLLARQPTREKSNKLFFPLSGENIW